MTSEQPDAYDLFRMVVRHVVARHRSGRAGFPRLKDGEIRQSVRHGYDRAAYPALPGEWTYESEDANVPEYVAGQFRWAFDGRDLDASDPYVQERLWPVVSRFLDQAIASGHGGAQRPVQFSRRRRRPTRRRRRPE